MVIKRQWIQPVKPVLPPIDGLGIEFYAILGKWVALSEWPTQVFSMWSFLSNPFGGSWYPHLNAVFVYQAIFPPFWGIIWKCEKVEYFNPRSRPPSWTDMFDCDWSLEREARLLSPLRCQNLNAWFVSSPEITTLESWRSDCLFALSIYIKKCVEFGKYTP